MKHTELFVYLALGLSFFISSCSSTPTVSQDEEFKTYWNKAGEFSILNDPQDSRRFEVQGEMLVFNGSIIEGDCERFASVVTEKTKTLVVNSQGGLTREGKCMAKIMLKNKFKETVVRGFCWSSCANYLFLASPQRTIERGTVGFHGNPIAMERTDRMFILLKKVNSKHKLTKNEIKEIREFFESNSKGSSLSKNELKDIAIFLKKGQDEVVTEREFQRQVGISQEIFDVTQIDDKGEGSGQPYMFLIPSSETFARYGIHGVRGSSDVEFVNKFNQRQSPGLLYR